MQKTVYRVASNGYFDFLQYLHEEEITLPHWLFWTRRQKVYTWKCIPRPYYDHLRGRADFTGASTYINTLNTRDLDSFALQYPNIHDYLAFYQQEQTRLVEAADQKNKEIAARKSTFRHL